MKIGNRALQIKVRKLTNAVTDLLQGHVEDRQYLRNYPKLLFKEKTGFEVQEETRFDFGLLVKDSLSKIKQLSEFTECAEYMTRNPTIKEHLQVECGHDWKTMDKVPLDTILTSELAPFLVAYFNKVGSLMFDEERFYDIYSDFENHFYAHSDRYNVTSPLENFQSGSDIDLGDGLRIRKITDEEIAQYLRQMESSMGIVTRFGMFPKGFGALNLGSVKHVLETTYLHQKGTAIDGSHCGESFEDIVTALRLFKSGSVDCNILLFVSASWHPYFGSMYSSKGRYTSPIGPKYTLLDSEVRSFRRIWKTYHNFRTKSVGLDSKKYLDIALKRFNLGIEEPDFEGKMIDYMISFEALLLPEASELKYRLSNRVATLLAEESRQATEIRKTLAKAYDLRSVIVHGGEFQPIKIEGITIESRDFCSTIENYLRMCIKLFIVLSETYKRQQAIIDIIDEALFNDELKRELARTRKREMVFLV